MANVNVMESAEKKSLNVLVRLAAVAKIPSKLNLMQFKADKEKCALHKRICADLVRLSDEHKIPMSFLVYLAISKTAHKISEFNKGYTKFNEERAVAIIKMAKAFAAHNGMSTPSDRVYHAMDTIYSKVTTDYNEFIAKLELMPQNKKFANVKDLLNQMGYKL